MYIALVSINKTDKPFLALVVGERITRAGYLYYKCFDGSDTHYIISSSVIKFDNSQLQNLENSKSQFNYTKEDLRVKADTQSLSEDEMIAVFIKSAEKYIPDILARRRYTYKKCIISQKVRYNFIIHCTKRHTYAIVNTWYVTVNNDSSNDMAKKIAAILQAKYPPT